MGYSWSGAAYKEREDGYHIVDVEKLRDKTKIGETIKFKIYRNYYFLDDAVVSGIVKGKVIAKYPHVFELDDGSTYSWVDYMLGKQMV